MANTLNGTVWVLDTANTTVVFDNRMLHIKSVRWDNATTANHKAVLKDKNGDTIWQSTAAGANNEDAELIEGIYDGIVMNQLDSGVLIVRLS